jgi:hypothetical protein
MADETNTELSAEDAAEQAEWDNAFEELAPGYQSKQEGNDDEQADPTTSTTTAAPEDVETTTTTTTVATTTDTTTEAPKAPGDGTGPAKDKSGEENSDEEEAPDQSNRTARQTAREAAAEVEAVAKDVRKEIFTHEEEIDGKKRQFLEDNDGNRYFLKDGKPVLSDKDGDAINTIQDVMGLMNPRTGEAFTEEEAAQWLLSAQQRFNQGLANMDNQINQISELNVDLKDQADSITFQYGELLKAMPELQEQLWAKYSKSFTTDPKTNIITAAPLSMEDFYEIALQPYVKLAEALEAQETERVEQEKVAADAKRKTTRLDRSDIYGRGKVDDMDDDEKEWAEANKSYFGGN